MLTRLSLWSTRPFWYRGLKTNVADLRKGDWVSHEEKSLIVHNVSSSFSGRGARHFTLTLKEPVGENLTTLKPSSRDMFEKLELQDMAYQFLYCADGVGYFLNPKTLEEISLPLNIVNENLCKVLEGGIDVKVRMNGDKAIYVHSSNRLYRCTIGKILEKRESTVVKVLIGINYVVQDRPSTVVQVQGGAKVNCPGLFEIGDQIMVMIDDLSYQGKPLG